MDTINQVNTLKINHVDGKYSIDVGMNFPSVESLISNAKRKGIRGLKLTAPCESIPSETTNPYGHVDQMRNASRGGLPPPPPRSARPGSRVSPAPAAGGGEGGEDVYSAMGHASGLADNSSPSAPEQSSGAPHDAAAAENLYAPPEPTEAHYADTEDPYMTMSHVLFLMGGGAGESGDAAAAAESSSDPTVNLGSIGSTEDDGAAAAEGTGAVLPEPSPGEGGGRKKKGGKRRPNGTSLSADGGGDAARADVKGYQNWPVGGLAGGENAAVAAAAAAAGGGGGGEPGEPRKCEQCGSMAAQGDVDESVNQWFCAQCWADFDVPDGSTGGGAEPAAKGSAVSKVMAERKELEEAWSPGDDYGVDETPTLSGDAPPPIPAYPGGQSGQQQEQAPPPKKDYQNWSAGAAAAAVDDDTGADEVVAPPPALQTSAPSVATGNVVYNAGGDRSSVSSNEVKPVQGYSQVDRDANGRVGVPTSPGAPAPPAAAVADDFYGPAEPKPPPPAAPLPPAAQEGRGGVGGGGGGVGNEDEAAAAPPVTRRSSSAGGAGKRGIARRQSRAMTMSRTNAFKYQMSITIPGKKGKKMYVVASSMNGAADGDTQAKLEIHKDKDCKSLAKATIRIKNVSQVIQAEKDKPSSKKPGRVMIKNSREAAMYVFTATSDDDAETLMAFLKEHCKEGTVRPKKA